MAGIGHHLGEGAGKVKCQQGVRASAVLKKPALKKQKMPAWPLSVEGDGRSRRSGQQQEPAQQATELGGHGIADAGLSRVRIIGQSPGRELLFK